MHSGILLAQADPRPIYLQIIEQVRQRIAVGDWVAGDALPSIRELAAEVRVSVITVKRAYLELERDGVITTRQGKGSVVAESPALPERLLEQQLDEHLASLAKLAVLMGLTIRDTNERVAAAIRRIKESE